jgi:hypothetical protein
VSAATPHVRIRHSSGHGPVDRTFRYRHATHALERGSRGGSRR